MLFCRKKKYFLTYEVRTIVYPYGREKKLKNSIPSVCRIQKLVKDGL